MHMATKVKIKSLMIESFWICEISIWVLDIIIKMEPSTMHMMIPQAPSTSPMDSDAEADLVSLVEVAQLTKFENRSGEELHQESRIAIKAPV